MADDIPAGWYPDIHGTVRWWDGARWTDHVRDSIEAATSPPEPMEHIPASTPTPASEPAAAGVTDSYGTATYAANLADDDLVEEPTSSDQSQIRNPLERYASETSSFAAPQPDSDSWSGTAVIHRPARTISYPKTVEEEIEDDDGGNRRIWLTATVVGLLAFFLGMGIGGRQVDPPENSEPIPPAATADTTDIDTLRQQLEERQAELDERQQVLDDREDDLDRRASATPSPTPTPTSTATETEIDGNDRVLVGTDVRKGTYRTNGPTDPLYECEYTVSEDEFGDDPITDESTKSAASVTLRDGDWFETDDCQDWERE